jgi:hypothetical protein
MENSSMIKPNAEPLRAAMTAAVVAALLLAGSSASRAAETAPPPAATPHPEATPGAAPSAWNHHGPDMLFSVALVVASNEAGAPPLPSGLQKAVEDVRGFLPYKSFRLVDAGLVRTNNQGIVALNGPGEVTWQARFSLVEQDQGVLVDRFAIQGHGPGAMDHLTHGSLEGSFRIKKGETVVVGSAALADNSKAMIVLFSAVP